LVDKLDNVCSIVISRNKNGFVKGQKTKDYICIAFEVVNMLSKTVKGGNIAIKIDISKAFDLLVGLFCCRLCITLVCTLPLSIGFMLF